MNTGEFIQVLKRERAWDIAPTLNLFACYVVPLIIISRIAGVRWAVLFGIGGLFVGIYVVLKEPVKNAFVEWWNSIPFYIHFVSLVFWGSLIFLINKGIFFSGKETEEIRK